MALQFSTAYRNAMLDAFETIAGTAVRIKIRTGAQPASCAAADSGTVLADITAPSDWMAAAANGTKAKSGTFEDNSADASGTPAHFRIYASDGTTCHMQGSVSGPGGGGNMVLDTSTLTQGQSFSITTFQLTAPGA